MRLTARRQPRSQFQDGYQQALEDLAAGALVLGVTRAGQVRLEVGPELAAKMFHFEGDLADDEPDDGAPVAASGRCRLRYVSDDRGRRWLLGSLVVGRA
jgi:hypothetical protein